MGEIILYIVEPERYFENVLKIIKKDASRKNLIYVTTNKPYNQLKTILKKNKINTEKIFFIDCISKKNFKKDVEKNSEENCIFLDSPQSITAISIAINESIKSIKSPKVLFFDSLSILLIYNDANTVGKFSNFLINKMRENDVEAMLFALESDADKDILKKVESFVDTIRRKEK